MQGGLGTYTYSYQSNTNAGDDEGIDYNRWQDKSTEVLPDGNQNVYYYNVNSQEMLNVFQQLDAPKTISSITYSGTTATVTSTAHGYSAGNVVVIRGADQPEYDGIFTITGVTTNTFTYTMASTPPSNATGSSLSARKLLNQWGRFIEYDSNGDAILTAEPSAVNLPANITTLESYADLMHYDPMAGGYQFLNTASGLIEVTDYYTSTSATGDGTGSTTAVSGQGGATGYIEDTAVKQGQSGTPIPQESWQYYVQTGGGATIYPLATDTVYASTGSGLPRTTSHFYSWYSGTVQMQSETVIQPPITNASNGPATSTSDLTHGDTVTTDFDAEGRTTSVTDGDGYVTTTAYNDALNAVTQVVDPGGLALTTVTTNDNQGRPLKVVDPNSNDTYIVYKDAQDLTTGFANEVRVYRGWHEIGTSGTYTSTGPVQVTRYNRPGSFGESLTYAAPVLGSSAPNGSDSIGTIESLSRQLDSAAGLVTEDDSYAALPGTGYAYTPFQLTGTGASIAATTKTYDSFGDPFQTKDPNGTISSTVYDARRRVASTWVGTNANGATASDPTGGHASGNNMTEVEADYYDTDPATGASSAGDGNLTQVVDFADSTASHNRVTLSLFDPRDRLIATKVGAVMSTTTPTEDNLAGESGTATRITYNDLDNAGEATGTYTYVGTGVSLDDFATWTAPGSSGPGTGTDAADLSADSQSQYDDQGRVYQTTVYPVDPSTAAVGTYGLSTNTYYGHRGNVIETAAPGGVVTKSVLDAAGRNTITYTTDGASGAGWSNASSVVGDDVLEQITNTIDGAGNVLLTADAQRDQDYTGTGALASATTNHQDRVTYTANWYDAADRLTDSVDLGTNGGQAYAYPTTNPGLPPAKNVTGSSNAAGSTTTLVDTSRGEPSGYFAGYTLTVNSGADAGDSAAVSAYNSATGTFTLATALPSATASGVNYVLTPGSLTGTASSGTASTLVSSTLAQPSGTLAGWSLTITGGTYNVGTVVTVTGYNASTGALTFAPALTSGHPIDSTTQYALAEPALLTHADYDAAGNVADTLDPRAIVTKDGYDLRGQATSVISAYTEGTPTNSTNQTTDYAYDGNGNVTSQTAVMPSGGHDQVTDYLYGVTTGGGSAVNSNDLLATTEYPDPSSGAASTSPGNDVTDTYNALGEVTTMQDENGSVHTYGYDLIGRETSDAVTTLGSGVDGTVRNRSFTYTALGLPLLSSTYASSAGTGTPLTQVEDAYNGLGQLTQEYQSHSGAVVTSGPSATPSVQYAYAGPASGENYSRLSAVTYPLATTTFPNHPEVHYVYNSGIDDAVSRVSALADDDGSGGVGSHIADYQYLGPSTVVNQADANNVTLSYYSSGTSDSYDQYTGLDEHDQIAEQKYTKTATPTPTATQDLLYGRDQDGNVLDELNNLSTSNSQLYHANSTSAGDNASAYDLLNRITNFRRGTLSQSTTHNNGTTGTASYDTVSTASQTAGWTLDAVGNWTTSTSAAGTQSRGHNARNEISSISGGGAAATPTFDSNGNMTKDQAGNPLAYDAWNDEVGYTWLIGGGPSAGSAETYTVDALGRRVADAYSQPPTFTGCVCNFDISDNYYYSDRGQVLQDAACTVTYNSCTCGCYCGCGCGCCCGTWSGFSCECCCTTQSFLWGPGYVNDLVLRDLVGTDTHTDAGGSGDTHTTTITAQRLYAQHDANFDVTALVDTSGAVKQRQEYSPYGAVTVLSPTWGGASDAYGLQVGFQGMWLDTNTLLYHTPNRDYSTYLGRWIQQDPAGYVDGSDLYQANDSNPLVFVDPMGTATVTFPLQRKVDGTPVTLINQIVHVDSHLGAAIPYVNLSLELRRPNDKTSWENWNSVMRDLPFGRVDQLKGLPGTVDNRQFMPELIGPNLAMYFNNGYNPGRGKDYQRDDEAVVFVQDFRSVNGRQEEVTAERPLISNEWTAGDGYAGREKDEGTIINDIRSATFTMYLTRCPSKGVWKMFFYYLNPDFVEGQQVLGEYDVTWAYDKHTFNYSVTSPKKVSNPAKGFDFQQWRSGVLGADSDTPATEGGELPNTVEDLETVEGYGG